MHISGRQHLLVIDADAEVSDLFLDMAESVGHTGGNDDDVPRGDCLYLTVGHGASAAGPDEFADRRDIGGKLDGISFIAAGNQNAGTGKNVVHLGYPVMQYRGDFLALGAGAHPAQNADPHVEVVADIDHPDLLIDGLAQIFEDGHDLRVRDMGGVVRLLGLDAGNEGKRNCRDDGFQGIAVHSFHSD